MRWLAAMALPLTLTLSLALSSGREGCPDFCVCMWKSGKETTECIEQDLAAIPGGVAAGTQVLDLRGNRIDALRDEEFVLKGITNLQRIYFADCKASQFPLSFFCLAIVIEDGLLSKKRIFLSLFHRSMKSVPRRFEGLPTSWSLISQATE